MKSAIPSDPEPKWMRKTRIMLGFFAALCVIYSAVIVPIRFDDFHLLPDGAASFAPSIGTNGLVSTCSGPGTASARSATSSSFVSIEMPSQEPASRRATSSGCAETRL